MRQDAVIGDIHRDVDGELLHEIVQALGVEGLDPGAEDGLDWMTHIDGCGFAVRCGGHGGRAGGRLGRRLSHRRHGDVP
jgi:hypothetical protein